MIFKQYIILLAAALCALTGFARAADNRTFNRFYHLSPKEFEEQIYYFFHHNLTDSAMLCANIQASKYGNEKLTTEEIKACCSAFRDLGVEYLTHYYNFQNAAECYLKAEQIADKHRLEQFKTIIEVDKACLIFVRNQLENNFIYNNIDIEGFKKAFCRTLEYPASADKEYSIFITEMAASNMLYLALKYDKAKEVTNEVQAYHEAQERSGTCCNIAELFCQAIDYNIAGNYDKAFDVLQTPINRPNYYNDRDYIQAQAMVKIAQYAILLKSGKRTEALKLLLWQEQFLRKNNITFEQLEVLQLLRQHYEIDGNKTLADNYALLYYTTKDEFINRSRVGKMDQAKLNLELEETREHIREMSYRQQMQTILLWSSIIITLLALTLLAVLYANYRKTKRTNRLLYEKNVALLNANKELRPSITEITENPTQEGHTQADLELIERITAVMESSPEVYKETFSRQRLAELVGSNYKAVSRAINTCKGCNFNMLLNEYRIKEACRRLMDTATYGSYTIEAIANSIGYKSRSNFATVFKEIVGLTPSAFQKMHQQDQIPHPTIET